MVTRTGIALSTLVAVGFGLAAPVAAAAPTATTAVAATPATSANSVIALSSLSFESQSVDATVGTTVALDWSVTDSAKKAQIIWGSIDIRQQGASPGTYLGPIHEVTFGTSWDGTISVLNSSGDVHNSTYRYAFPVPQYAATDHATWVVSNVSIRDDASHQHKYNATTLSAFDASFTATELVDSTPPALAIFTLGSEQPDAVNVADRPVQVDYEFNITEEESGFDGGRFVVQGPDGQTISTQFEMTIQDGLPTCGTDEESIFDPVCDIVVTIPQGAAVGTWTVTTVELTDVAGNREATHHLDLAPLIVTHNAVVRASGFALSSTVVNNWLGPVIVDLSMTVADAAPVTSVITQGTCGQTTAVPTDDGDGTISVPMMLFERAPRCVVSGIKVTDSAGDVSVYGSFYGQPDLGLAITEIPDTTPPVATGASLSATLFSASETPRNLGVDIQVQSAVGVVDADIVVYDSTGVPVAGSFGGVQQETDGTINDFVSLPQLTPGTYTVGFIITDAGGLSGVYGSPGLPTPPWGELEFTVTE